MPQTKTQSAKIIRAGLDKNHNNFYQDTIRYPVHSSPRIPEIQMINRFYGLIPKKFAINERIQPTVSLIRQKSFGRPKTARPLRSNSPSVNLNSGLNNKTGNNPQLRRYSSVDSPQVMHLSESPLLTKRISFEKVNAKQVKKLEQKVEQNKEIIPENLLKNHRILKIDLSQIRKEEDQIGESLPTEIIRETAYISDDSETEDEISNSNFPKANELEIKKTTPRPITAGPKILSNTNISLISSNEKINSNISGPAEPVKLTTTNEPHWTQGKTTAERRSKFQKSFSIHPSFKMSMSLDGAEDSEPLSQQSELSSYPSSMVRTGRRALHVEELPEVDTLVSNFNKKKSKSKSLDETFDGNYAATTTSNARYFRRESCTSQQDVSNSNPIYSKVIEHVPIIRKPYALQANSNTSEVLAQLLNSNKNLLATLNCKSTIGTITKTSPPPPPVPSLPKKTEKKPQPILKKSNSITAFEKRKLFSKKSVSLPSLSNESHGKKVDKKKPHNHHHSNRPASTIGHANLNPKADSHNHKGKVKETNLTDHAKKNPNAFNLVNHNKSMSLNRPKTAPSPAALGNNKLVNSSNKGSPQDDGCGSVNLKNKAHRPTTELTNGSTSRNSRIVPGSTSSAPSVLNKLDTNTNIKPTLPKHLEQQPLKHVRIKGAHHYKVSSTTNSCVVKFSEENSRKENQIDTSDFIENTGKVVPSEMEAEKPLLEEQEVKMMPRRSFSLDEASLLSYSTSISESIDSIETSLLNSKKREECLKIYEKMLKQGSPIRLQTIFRGMMTPSEYRTFIAAAEKAAKSSIDNSDSNSGLEEDKNNAETISD